MTQHSKIVTLPSQTWAFITCRSALQANEISATTDKAFAQLAEAMARGGVRSNGPPRAHYHYRDQTGIGFDLGFPIVPEDAAAALRAGLAVAQTPSCEALTRVHEGRYSTLAATYKEMEQELKAQGFAGCGDVWEIYLNDPDDTPPDALRTQIYWPIERGAQPNDPEASP